MDVNHAFVARERPFGVDGHVGYHSQSASRPWAKGTFFPFTSEQTVASIGTVVAREKAFGGEGGGLP